MFYNIKDLLKWENKSTVYSIKLIIFGEHDVRVRIPLKFSIRQNSENGVSEETLNQCGLNGEFYERGIFNGQPVYSNGMTKFVWLPEATSEDGTVYPEGYYQFYEVPDVDLTNAVDVTGQVSGALEEYANSLEVN